MRVGGHVVEPGPGVVDPAPAAGGKRFASRRSRSAKTDSSTPVSKPHRGSPSDIARTSRSPRRRKWKPLGLDHHRQALRERCNRRGREELPAERPHGQLHPELGRERRRPGAAGDDDGVGPAEQLRRRGALVHIDPERGSAPDELARHRRRVGDAVRSAERGAEHVVDRQPGHEGRVDTGHRNPEPLPEASIRSSSAANPSSVVARKR